MSVDRKRPRNTGSCIASVGIKRGRRDSRGVVKADQRPRKHNGNSIKTTGSTLLMDFLFKLRLLGGSSFNTTLR